MRDFSDQEPKPASSRPLYNEATTAAWVGLLFNLALGVVKLVAGVLGRSFALVSDAVNSLGDCVTSGVVLFGLRAAQRPPDPEHPYGHTRAETIAASNVALLIMVSAMAVGWEAIGRLGVEHSPPPIWALWIAGANVVIKESLYRYKVGVGGRTGSVAIIANAWDHRSDAFCSLAVLVGLAAVRWAGPSYGWADNAAALAVVVGILVSAGALFRRAASELMDPQATGPMLDRVRSIASAVPGVLGIETVWMRKSGLEYFVDIHLEVDPGLTVAEGHLIGHRAKAEIVAQLAAVRDVLVHLEPFRD